MNTERKKIHVLALIIAVAAPLFVGGLSAFLTAGDMKIYETLDQPSLAPPGWIFPIAWTILYILMGLASYLVYTSDAESAKKRKALIFYCIQLAMNLLWCTLFFTYRKFLISLIWLLIMWGIIIVCVVRFYKIRKSAGLTMLPLLLWTTFAAYLNYGCMILNS